MLTLNDLLSTYERQGTIDITDPLARLQQPVATDRLSIQQAESKLLQAQQDCLDQMRLYFAIDARALLQSPQFAAFVEFLVESVARDRIGSAHPLLVASSPTFWLLPSTEIALHLRDIQPIQLDNPDGTAGVAVVQMQVAIQDWQQPVHVFSDALRQQCQVAAVLHQIQSQLPRADPTDPGIAHLNCVVTQELAVCCCLWLGSSASTA